MKEELQPAGAWVLVGVLFAIVAITLPELGSDPWRFRPPQVDPQGPLAPLVRAAGEEWEVGIARAACFVAALLCGTAALLLCFGLLAGPGGAYDFAAIRLRAHGGVAGVPVLVLALVGAGLGAAVIPRLGRGAVPKGVVIVRSTPTLRRQVYAVWRADATRRSAIRAAVEAFQAAGRRQDARR